MLARGRRSPFTGNVPSGPCSLAGALAGVRRAPCGRPCLSPHLNRARHLTRRFPSLFCLSVAQRRIKAIRDLERVASRVLGYVYMYAYIYFYVMYRSIIIIITKPNGKASKIVIKGETEVTSMAINSNNRDEKSCT